MSDEITHKRVLLDLLRRRLQEREIQEAQYGVAADPIIRIEITDLKQRIQTLNDEIGLLERSTNVAQTASAITSSPHHVAQEMLDLLDIAYTTFVAQNRVRDKLVEMLYNRLKITQRYQYEELFSRYYDQMTPEERHFHATMRTYTANILAVNNTQVLNLINSNPDLIRHIPSLKQLRQHLTLWVSKYQGLFQSTPHMAFVYVGVEEGVPFPRTITQDIRDFLAAQPPTTG